MHSFIYKFSAFIAIIALVGALLNGVSMPTGVLRAGLVFLGTLLLFVLGLNLVRWVVITTTIIEQNEADNAANNEVKEAPVKKNLQPMETPPELGN